jgi:hypothetical protein
MDYKENSTLSFNPKEKDVSGRPYKITINILDESKKVGSFDLKVTVLPGPAAPTIRNQTFNVTNQASL